MNARHKEPWTAEDLAQLAAFASQGFSRAEAARVMGRTEPAINSRTRKTRIRWRATTGAVVPDGSARAMLHYGGDGTRDAFVGHILKRGLAGTARHYGLSESTISVLRDAVGLPKGIPRRGSRTGAI